MCRKQDRKKKNSSKNYKLETRNTKIASCVMKDLSQALTEATGGMGSDMAAPEGILENRIPKNEESLWVGDPGQGGWG